MFVRKPAVAGTFYPSDKSELQALIRECYLSPVGPRTLPPSPESSDKIVSVVSPHAGYVYSGAVAAHSYLHVSSLRDPELLVMVAPDHYGSGSSVSTFEEGLWETPLGQLKVDSDSAARLHEQGGAVFDPESQLREHSLEVQLPFLQMIYGDKTPLLPISMTDQDEETATSLGAAIAKVVKDKKAVLVASSDLTHYESAASAKKKDSEALEAIVAMDIGAFYDTIATLRMTACGYGPIAAVTEASRRLGLGKAEVLKYATSGDTSGDNLQVVGYGSLRFTR